LAVVSRRLLGAGVAALAVVLVAAGYLFFVRDSTVEPRLMDAVATSVIGSGEDAIGVSAEGVVLVALPPPEDGTLPALPLADPPQGGRLAGPALEQARVLGAAPTALRPCIEGSEYGESGVDVELRSGIELRFGDAGQAPQKWRSAVAVLANPAIVALDYVDLHSPGRPAVYGEGHSLPSAEEGAGSTCIVSADAG
jgi:cell division septal protein FtsQ